MEDTVETAGNDKDDELIKAASAVLADTLEELEAAYPTAYIGTKTLSDTFIAPTSFDTPSLSFVDNSLKAALFQMYWNNHPRFSNLGDEDKASRAEFSIDDPEDLDGPIEPQIFVDPFTFDKKTIFTDAIFNELWKSICAKDAERKKDRDNLSTNAKVLVGVIGTKLSTQYGMVPTAMTALVGATLLWISKVGIRAFCTAMEEREKKKPLT